MKCIFAALICVCTLPSFARAQDQPPALIDRLAAFGFPFDEEWNPGVGRVSVGDLDLVVLADSYAVVVRRTGDVVRSGPLYFAFVDDNTVEMTFFGDEDRYEYTFTPAEVSDSGVYATGQVVRNGVATPTNAQWYDLSHVHAEIIEGEIIPVTGDITKKECRCACSDGTSNPAGCTTAACFAQLPCAPDPCAVQQRPAELGEPAEMAAAAFGNCKWMDPCPPECGSRELGLAMLGVAGAGLILLRRKLTT